MKKQFKALGHEFSVAPATQSAAEEAVKDENKGLIDEAVKKLLKFRAGKEKLETKIIENEKWYRMRHWEMVQQQQEGIKSKSAWLFNSIYNKHADAMDNYPEPNILPREQADVKEAKKLSKIVPLVLEYNNFEATYSSNWWEKLIQGCACYSVVWDNNKENGLGDISIKQIDLLNIYWQPGITDLQDSSDIFLCTLVDTDVIKGQYPQLASQIQDNKVIELKEYDTDDKVDTTGKSLVVDWYFKGVNSEGKQILNYVKFTGSTVLYSSMQVPEYAERGYYDHGLYPFFMDILFPIKGSPAGFGCVDLMKDDQAYIDKLDSVILENAFKKGKPRYFAKEKMGINEEEYADYTKEIVHYAGSDPNEEIKEIKVPDLPVFIREHRLAKIEELKETSGNRDFSQGASSGGVTAAAAIAALQEAGNKLSRDNIKGAYRIYSDMIGMCIELIRQFYDETRQFRIVGEQGEEEFIEYNNQGIKEKVLPGITGEIYKSSVFDITIKAQKANPYSRMSQNELAKELYGAGFFKPEMADQALIALELMDFEGKQNIITKINRNKTLQAQLQLAIQFAYNATGVDITPFLQGGQMPGASMPGQAAAKDKSYAQRIQENAQVSVNKGGEQ